MTSDNDPVTLLTYVAAALDGLRPLEPGIWDAIGSPSVSARVVVGRLLSELAESAPPVLVVIDDAHRSTTGRASMSSRS